MDLAESSFQHLYNSAVRAFPNTRRRQHVQHTVAIENIRILPYLGTRTLKDVVQVLKMKSEIASQILKDQFFDFIFLDADHCYESVKRDILQYLPKTKPGGIFSGHDCEMKLSDCLDRTIIEQYKDGGFYEKEDEEWIAGIGLHAGVIAAVGELLPQYHVQDRIFWTVVD